MFFDSTPNFLYPDFKEPGKVKLSKNIFRRIRVRDSFNAVYASSKPYTIISGETPDSIAYNNLGGSEWYWTILLLNNITNIEQEWPLSDDELDKYIEKKYGDQIDAIRHWETKEIKDSDGNVVIEGGIIVEQYTGSTEQLQPNYLPRIKNPDGGLVTSVSVVYGDSGYSDSNGVRTITQSGGGRNLVLDITTDSNGTITNATIPANYNTSENFKPGDTVKVYGGNAIVKVETASDIWTVWTQDYTYNYTQSMIEDENGNTGYSVSGTVKTATAVEDLVVVTNREYEYQLNEIKKNIYLPTLSVLPTMRSELEDLLAYDTEYKITKQGYRESEEV